MAAVKSAGMGDNFYIGGYNLSADINSLGTISGGNAPMEVTGISSSAIERIGGQRNGTIEFTTFFDKQTGQEHAILKTLPTADTQCMYFRGTTVGNQAAAMLAKQVNYDGTRAADGAFTLNVQAVSNGYGLEWGQMLTAGVRTDASATAAGTSIDTLASLSFGYQAYLQVFSFSGTDATVRIQDSADNSSFNTVVNFTQITGGAPLTERNGSVNTFTVRQYVRVITLSSGGFTNLAFAVMIKKNTEAGQLF